ncbi:A disintegrin and metalloproteinase with thrombospondin motifs 7 isoform X2 [Megachile rotundata]|uniref:A disintegrin and metalloproteinase with thrombospondin motifs 7 isoform X2 n=1 Tax=Megachile rotundata TaxID=143995 RepID=UPI000614C0A1|nr:PREDICTED: A disintegrin and metalloproteinase with thrombospondin motifs 7-like [Megachile rotundata]
MNEFQTLLTFLGILVTADGNVLDKYTRAPGNVYHGRYTRDIHEPELLVPRKVFEDGSFNTYSLPNFYDRQEVSERRKRSTNEEDQSEIDKLHLILPINGIEHHVELSPYHEFISPDMVIETRGSGISTNLNDAVRFKRAPDRQCHYRGVIRGHHGSRAALSLCDGVAGYVQTDHGRYFIEPLHEVIPEVDGQHVHVAYKRDAPHEKKGSQDGAPKRHCTTGDDWEAAWAEQLAERQKRLLEDNSIGTKRDSPASFATHSIHRYIEIGLVADRRFLDYYNNTDYEQYLLTVMNMVSDFYHDKSVGNQIDVVVVRMIYLEKEKEEIDLLISPAAEETLASFAKWAEKMNPPDSTHPNHHDIGVLVTRYDICSEGTNCDLMGLAYVGVACNPAKAACINEDSGLLLGIVVAHEVGHVMGCAHDEPDVSGCPSKDSTDDSFFLMSPIVFLFTIRWSSCSRKFITTFLESGLGECLNDDPKNPSDKFKYPNMLPGAMYNPDAQCSMMFPEGIWCKNPEHRTCEYLWCKVNETGCLSHGYPMADGTKCGENKWCMRKQCVDIGTRPTAVHGGWGKWGPAGSCSRTCGGGIKVAERECDNPPPANGGRYCMGERKRLTACNTTPCDPTKPSFYAYQCSLFNNVKVLTDGLHTWSPYYAPNNDRCALFCINEKRSFAKVAASVNDSTPCKPGTNNMCVGGVCRKVGCDWIFGSDAVEDKCGICKGDGTKCKAVEGFYNTTLVTSRYMKIVTIPKGARSITAEEVAPYRNSLAIRYEKNDVYCLNGNMTEQRNGDYPCANAIIIYQHPEPKREEIYIKGPIAEDIRLEYVFYNPTFNPGIRYEYYVMSSDPSYTPKYIWDFTEWSECTAKCGGGTMVSEPACIEENSGKVTPSFCKDIPRPDPKSRICNAEPCPAKWRVSQWSKCSACDGKKGTRHRKVQCVKPAARAGEDDVQANFNACKGRVPKQQEECVGKRPCKKTCPKRSRDVKKDVPAEKEKQPISPKEQSRLIDKFVDLSLARYLEKSRSGLSIEANEFEGTGDLAKFRQLLRDWSIADMDKKKRGTCPKKFTTPKPGSIIKDVVLEKNVVLMEAPYVDDGLQANLSDKAFQQSGDVVGIGIDTSRQKVYNGSKAIQKIEHLLNPKTTPAAGT